MARGSIGSEQWRRGWQRESRLLERVRLAAWRREMAELERTWAIASAHDLLIRSAVRAHVRALGSVASRRALKAHASISGGRPRVRRHAVITLLISSRLRFATAAPFPTSLETIRSCLSRDSSRAVVFNRALTAAKLACTYPLSYPLSYPLCRSRHVAPAVPTLSPSQ